MRSLRCELDIGYKRTFNYYRTVNSEDEGPIYRSDRNGRQVAAPPAVSNDSGGSVWIESSIRNQAGSMIQLLDSSDCNVSRASKEKKISDS